MVPLGAFRFPSPFVAPSSVEFQLHGAPLSFLGKFSELLMTTTMLCILRDSVHRAMTLFPINPLSGKLLRVPRNRFDPHLGRPHPRGDDRSAHFSKIPQRPAAESVRMANIPVAPAAPSVCDQLSNLENLNFLNENLFQGGLAVLVESLFQRKTAKLLIGHDRHLEPAGTL